MSSNKPADKGQKVEEILREYFRASGYFVVRGARYVHGNADVTDVDLWLYQRASLFNRQRLNVDAKSRRVPQAMERVLWAKGLQVCLQLDASVVATMDSREAVKQFAELQGVILLDGHFLSRLKTKYAANNERFSDEEFHALIRSSKSDRLGVQWLDRLIFAKSRVLSDLDFNGCNSLLADVRYFAEQVRAVPHRREVALRSLYLAISLFLVALDFTMLDFAFEDKQAQLKRLIDGFRFGTAGASGAAKIFAVASNLVGAYADTKAPQREFAQMLKEQASELPVEIIAEFALKSSRALFDLARSFENFAYQRQFQPAQSLSPEHKAVIGAALDFFGMDRKAFFDVQTNESQDSRAISQISV
jgi:hypothetical protein